LSALSKAARAVLETASLPLTSSRTISMASGTAPGSDMEESLENSRYVPGACTPSARIRSAMSSRAAHSSEYWVMNIWCSVLNSGPVTFQWKLWVIRYSVYESASILASSCATAARSFAVMPMSMKMPSTDFMQDLLVTLAISDLQKSVNNRI